MPESEVAKVFEENRYVKWFIDPELAKDWKNLLKKYPYLFWIQSMNVRDRKQWAVLVRKYSPELRSPVKVHGAESYADITLARRDAWFQVFRSLTEVSLNLVRELQEGEYIRSLRSCFGRLLGEAQVEKQLERLERVRREFEHLKPEKLQRELEAERFTIFDDDLMPYLSAHESVYRSEKQIMGDLTAEVKNLYRRAGYVVDKSRGNLPPDEAKLETEFIYRLIEDEVSAWRRGDRETALALLELQREFIQEHAAMWLPYMFADLASREFRVGIAKKYHGDVRDERQYSREDLVVEMDFLQAMGELGRMLVELEYLQVEEMLQAARQLSAEELMRAFSAARPLSLQGENTYLLRTGGDA